MGYRRREKKYTSRKTSYEASGCAIILLSRQTFKHTFACTYMWTLTNPNNWLTIAHPWWEEKSTAILDANSVAESHFELVIGATNCIKPQTAYNITRLSHPLFPWAWMWVWMVVCHHDFTDCQVHSSFLINWVLSILYPAWQTNCPPPSQQLNQCWIFFWAGIKHWFACFNIFFATGLFLAF